MIKTKSLADDADPAITSLYTPSLLFAAVNAATFSGSVVDSATGKAIPNAIVTVGSKVARTNGERRISNRSGWNCSRGARLWIFAVSNHGGSARRESRANEIDRHHAARAVSFVLGSGDAQHS